MMPRNHSVMQQCPPPLPYSLPPVVVSPMVFPSGSYQQSSVSPLPSRPQLPLSGVCPASTGIHNPLEDKHDRLEKAVQPILSLQDEMKTDVKDMKNRLARMERQTQGKEVTRGNLPEGLQFPLKSSEDVECLELDLKTNTGKSARLVPILLGNYLKMAQIVCP